MKQFSLSRLLLPVAFVAVAACQHGPTKVTENQQPAPVAESAQSYVTRILRQHPVILDVQSPLDYGVSHVPGAINTRWEDFTQPGGRPRGVLDSDRVALARRLALWGIDPETPVLVVGMGPEGLGEEGRLGWTLRLLGVKSVETGSIHLFRGQIPRETEGRPPNKNYWKPDPRDELELKPDEFRRLATTKALGPVPTRARQAALQIPGDVGDRPVGRVIVDLRHPNEKSLPIVPHGEALAWPVVSLSWRDFFDESGRGRCAVIDQLAARGVTNRHEILLVDENGVGSAAAGFVLDSCRFGRPRVLSTGLRALD